MSEIFGKHTSWEVKSDNMIDGKYELTVMGGKIVSVAHASPKSDSPAREHADELVEALAFYANEENWRLNGPLDVNSPRFDGESRATTLLAKIREASNE